MAKTENKLTRGASQFTLTGNIKLSANSFSIDKISKTSGFQSNSLYMGVDCGDNNVVYSRMFDGFNASKKLYCFGYKVDENGHKSLNVDDRITVDWQDRFDEDILETIDESAFIKIGLTRGDDNKLIVYRFLSAYDAIQYMYSFFKDMTDEEKASTYVTVRGDLVYNYYDGKVSIQKNIKSIYLADPAKAEPKSQFVQTIYVSKDSVGKANMDDRTIPIDAIVPQYISKYEDQKIGEVVPLKIDMKINCSEENTKCAQYIIGRFNGSTAYTMLNVKGEFSEAGTTEEIDLSLLDKEVRAGYEAGAISLDDIRFAVTTGTHRVQNMMITSIALTSANSSDASGPRESLVKIKSNEEAFTAKEMNAMLADFAKKISDIENGPKDDKQIEEQVEAPVSDDDDVPFDTDKSAEKTDDWLKNFV